MLIGQNYQSINHLPKWTTQASREKQRLVYQTSNDFVGKIDFLHAHFCQVVKIQSLLQSQF
jgi:hypothetical protein